MKWRIAISALSLALCVVGSALAAPYPLITFDENGHGSLNFDGDISEMTGLLMADPGPGGLGSALTYNLQGPPSLVSGDVQIFEPGILSDLVRFNNYGTGGQSFASVVFYSNPVDGFDSLADSVSPPSSFYSNLLSINEVNGVATYTPSDGQPGFVPGFSVTYEIQSDPPSNPVPEPSTLILLCAGLAGIGLLRKRMRS